MKNVLFAFAFIAFFITSQCVLAGEYQIGVKEGITNIVSDFSLCKDDGGLCQISVTLESNDIIDIEARFEQLGTANLMFLYQGDYLRIGEDRERSFDFVFDPYYETKQDISLYHGPSETEEEFMGIKIPEPAAGDEDAFAEFTFFIKPVE
ncbi:MAG: hypothetical protein OEY94_06505 [Alphaproteobacteria bacterium]|nr:hypothetical protein [Alphaproteobacteria bacterium]